MIFSTSAFPQEIKVHNADSWELDGSLHLQHLHDPDRSGEGLVTDNGFRMRCVRLSGRGKLNDFIENTLPIEVRDNGPRLKDAEGKVKLAHSFYLRFGPI